MNRTVSKISIRRARAVLAIILIAGLLPAIGWTTFAASSGASIQGQDGWSGGTISIVPSVDQSLDQSGHNARTGQGTWRISNNTSSGNHNGSFAGWPFGPGLSVSAGQPSSGAGADQFRATVWFRSASATADGSYIEIDLGSAAGDDRNTNLSLQNKADADGGLLLRVNQWVGSISDFRRDWISASVMAMQRNSGVRGTRKTLKF